MIIKPGHLILFFSGLILNGLIAIPFINFLYNNRFYKQKTSKKVDTSKRNPSYYKHLIHNMDTPSSFGLLIALNLILYQVFIGGLGLLPLTVILVFFTFLGLADDLVKYFRYEKIQRWGLTVFQKLLLQSAGILAFLYITSPPYWLLPIFLVFGLFMTNATNITDGLDGLLGTLLLYILPTLAYFELSTYQNLDLVNLVIVIFSFLFIFMYFNIKPARVFLGDAGSMPLGLLIFLLGMRYHPVPVLVLFGLIIIEGLSSLIQMISIRVRNKKVFIIAPLHLHLLNKGWPDTKVVQRAGIIQLVLSLLAIYLFIIV